MISIVGTIETAGIIIILREDIVAMMMIKETEVEEVQRGMNLVNIIPLIRGHR